LKTQLGGDKSIKESGAVTAKLNDSKPNPFSTSTTITMTLPDDANQADIMIYNLEGK
jgi:hypothetical protein